MACSRRGYLILRYLKYILRAIECKYDATMPAMSLSIKSMFNLTMCTVDPGFQEYLLSNRCHSFIFHLSYACYS